jgi:hypothetical protein
MKPYDRVRVLDRYDDTILAHRCLFGLTGKSCDGNFAIDNDKRRVFCSHTRYSRLNSFHLISTSMSQDHLETIIKRARLAVGAAHDEFQALYAAAHKNTIPSSLVSAGADLDQLSINLALLVRNTSALISSGHVSELFQTRVSSGVTLSHAIVHDMSAIANQLRSMRTLGSSEPLSTVYHHQCRDIEEMVKRYDRIMSSVLHHHTS